MKDKTNGVVSVTFYRGSGTPTLTIKRMNSSKDYMVGQISGKQLTQKREKIIWRIVNGSQWECDPDLVEVKGVRDLGINVKFRRLTTFEGFDHPENREEIINAIDDLLRDGVSIKRNLLHSNMAGSFRIMAAVTGRWAKQVGIVAMSIRNYGKVVAMKDKP